MKKIFYIAFLMIMTYSIMNALTTKDIFINKDIVFFGVDFSGVKFIGADGFKNLPKIVEKQLPDINELFAKEPEKYNIRNCFHKENVFMHLEMVKRLNQKIRIDKLLVERTQSIEKAELEKMITNYNTEDKSGIGLVFVVESLNKYAENGTYYVVFFDIASKNILFSHQITAKAGGFGFRNYWAKIFFNGLKSCEALYYSWEKEYMK